MLTITAAVLSPHSLFACAVCFGDKNSTAVQSAGMGILTLLIITVGMLGTIAAFFLVLAHRARKHAMADREPSLLDLEDATDTADRNRETAVTPARHRRPSQQTGAHRHGTTPFKRRFSVSP